MPFHSRAGCAAHVHSQIISLRVIRSLQHRLHLLRQTHHLRQRVRVSSREIGDVRVRHDHHVAGRIGIAIENDEVFFAAENDVRAGILIGGDGAAENAAVVFPARGDILVTPGTPKIIQSCLPYAQVPAGEEDFALLTKSFNSLLGLKNGILLRRHFHLGAGLRIASGAAAALPRAETAEAANFDLVAGLQSGDDAVENRFDHQLRILAWQFRDARDLLDEIRFRHSAFLHVFAGNIGHRVAALLSKSPGAIRVHLCDAPKSKSASRRIERYLLPRRAYVPLQMPCGFTRRPLHITNPPLGK